MQTLDAGMAILVCMFESQYQDLSENWTEKKPLGHKTPMDPCPFLIPFPKCLSTKFTISNEESGEVAGPRSEISKSNRDYI